MSKSRKGRRKQSLSSRISTGHSSAVQSGEREGKRRDRKRIRPARRERLLLAGVLLATALAFSNGLGGRFVYDDKVQVIKNPTITTLANIPKMFTQSVWQFMNKADRQAVGPYYRPLFNIALIINYHVFGLKVIGWHLSSLLLHLIAVLLVYLLARQWGLALEVALASALLFGVHPVHSESVAWVSALPDPMASVFILASLLLYERYFHGRGGKPFILGTSAVLALMALISKEVAIAFPLFLIAHEFIDRPEGETFVKTAIRVAKCVAPFLAVAVLYLVLRYLVLGFISRPEPSAARIPATQALITIPSVLLTYTRLLTAPFSLAVFYDNTYVKSIADPRFWAAALALAVIVGAVIWFVRSSRTGWRALAFMVIFLLPVLNLRVFRAEESLLHDRYLYLPSIGFCLLVAVAIDWLVARFASGQRKAFLVPLVLVGLPLFGLTVYQNQFWQDDMAMTANALSKTPRWPFLHNYIGAYYFEQKKLAEAEQAYLEAIKISPDYYDAYSNLGEVYRLQGRFDEAVQAYTKAIENGAPYADTYNNLGVTYTNQGRLFEAEEFLKKTLEIDPGHAKACYNLGWVYDRQGKTALAEQAYLDALRLDPAYPEPRINLAVLLTKQQRYDEALDHLQIARRYAPDQPVGLYALADVYMKTGKYKEAVDVLTRLSVREPQHRLAHTSLGLCYEVLGNKEQAKVHFQKAIEVAPQDPYTEVAREHLARL